MRRLRTTTWFLFVGCALLNAVAAGVLFAKNKPLLGCVVVGVAVLCVASAVMLHLFSAAYEDEIDKLETVNDGLNKIAKAVEEQRRRQGSGPEQ